MRILLAATMLLATGLAAGPAPAQDQAQGRERCYGVAPAGGNDGIGTGTTAGGSNVDYQGDAWMWVEAGTCMTLPLPVQSDGTPRRGALLPLDRDRP